jgi:hypothetical protein
MQRIPIALFCVVLWTSAGCGPALSSYLIVSAQAELDGARVADAEKHAVYEFTAASEYLAKAREEQGYADFGPSIDYAFKATELAKQARTRAFQEREKQTPPAGGPAPVSGPAAEPEPAAPQVIIKKKTSVQIVPITPEAGTRPPQ